MFRHPHYLDIPWDMHWRPEPHVTHWFFWWLVAAATLLAMFVIGVGVTGGALF